MNNWKLKMGDNTFTVHELRRTFNALARRAGAGGIVIRSLTGHLTMSTVVDCEPRFSPKRIVLLTGRWLMSTVTPIGVSLVTLAPSTVMTADADAGPVGGTVWCDEVEPRRHDGGLELRAHHSQRRIRMFFTTGASHVASRVWKAAFKDRRATRRYARGSGSPRRSRPTRGQIRGRKR